MNQYNLIGFDIFALSYNRKLILIIGSLPKNLIYTRFSHLEITDVVGEMYSA